jgi:crossover junction endodeoxyribonuclease RusA
MAGVIQLPWPPTVNHYYTVSRGRKILSEAGRAYKAYAVQCMLIQRIPKLEKGDAPFGLHILARPPDKRRRDLDNLLKPIIDSLVDYGAIPDDWMVDDIRIQRLNKVKDGQIEVQIL